MADLLDFRARGESNVAAEIEDLAFAVIGAAIEIHRQLGPGMAEIHYKNAMRQELTLRGIAHEVEVEVDVIYKGVRIGTARHDLLVGKLLVVELKAVEMLSPLHRSQALTYLRLTKLPLALLMNFNTAILRDGIKRVINS